MAAAEASPAVSHWWCVVMGVSGSGKSSVGEAIARVWNDTRCSCSADARSHAEAESVSEAEADPAPAARFLDGDDFHSQASRDKMAAGQPLGDADREPWLQQLSDLRRQSMDTHGQPTVLACSALKPAYREMLFGRRARLDDSEGPPPQPQPPAAAAAPPRMFLVYLQASEQLLLQRLRARSGHYMKADMLASQLATLVAPTDSECEHLGVHFIPIDMEQQRTVEQEAQMAVQCMRQHMQRERAVAAT